MSLLWSIFIFKVLIIHFGHLMSLLWSIFIFKVMVNRANKLLILDKIMKYHSVPSFSLK
jgi:hypothetical protein